jgi:protein-S-isoprenylcysteine O-methyltransferase Ste14
MVRPSFKKWFNTVIPEVAQRSTYTLLSAFFLALIIHFWMPIKGYLWYFESGLVFWTVSALYVIAWAVATLATFQIDHFELFGLHQIWRYLKKLPEPVVQFKENGFYKTMRHPIQAGTMLGLWATPQMSIGHLLFAVSFSIYIFTGLYFEERDLVKTLGEAYTDYKKRVPMLFPKLY